MEGTHIEWADHTFNPWEGCTKISPGCAHCYAEARNIRFSNGANWGAGAPRRRTSEANWREPIGWNREAARLTANPECPKGWRFTNSEKWADGEAYRPRVFCASLADWLDDEVPIEWLADLLKLIHDTPNLDWLLLTKRPENWHVRCLAALDYVAGNTTAEHGLDIDPPEDFEWLNEWLGGNRIPANISIGTTVEDQARADERIPKLMAIPVKVRFLSCEPLLESVDLLLNGECSSWKCPVCGSKNVNPDAFTPEDDFSQYECRDCSTIGEPGEDCRWTSDIHWVICGGESGPGARPMHPDWARSLRKQCTAAHVPFFFKQWGEWAPHKPSAGGNLGGDLRSGRVVSVRSFESDDIRLPGCVYMARTGKKNAGRLLDDQEWNEFPKVEVTK